jgi:hypothetical protein
MLRRFCIGLLLVSTVCAQDLPKFKKPLPARAQILKMGWDGFEGWCGDNLAQWGEAQVDEMAGHYRDWRDEATAAEAGHLTGAEALRLDAAVKAVNRWQYSRCLAAGIYRGGSIYSHLGPREEASLADVKHQAVLGWKNSPQDKLEWPVSYQRMGDQPLKGSAELKQTLKEEEGFLTQAIAQVKKLPPGARVPLQKFMLNIGDISPGSRG